jgi:hypothetical protein
MDYSQASDYFVLDQKCPIETRDYRYGVARPKRGRWFCDGIAVEVKAPRVENEVLTEIYSRPPSSTISPHSCWSRDIDSIYK